MRSYRLSASGIAVKNAICPITLLLTHICFFLQQIFLTYCTKKLRCIFSCNLILEFCHLM